MHVEPITCYRPRPEAAGEFSSLPYDVFDRAAAAAYVAGHPKSFLAVERPETTFPPDHDMYADDVYQRAHDLLAERVADGTLLRDGTPCFYLYRLMSGGREQTGIVAACAVDDYANGIVRRHELTRPVKVDDRARHIAATGCQTGPIFLAYRDNPVMEALVEAAKLSDPLFDFTDEQGVRHTVWRVARPAAVESFRAMFAYIPCAYIVDGHHRAAAAARVCQRMRTEGGVDHTGEEAYNYLLCALFPAGQLRVEPYNRVVSDAGGLDEASLVSALEGAGMVVGARSDAPVRPSERGRMGMYAFGAWRELAYTGDRPDDPAGSLDAAILQDRVLGPVLGVEDPREDGRISFVPGMEGPEGLERRAGEKGVAFSLFPTTMAELMAVSDAGLLMPPKSTWLEPKLRSGLFVRRVSHRNSILDGCRRRSDEKGQ